MADLCALIDNDVPNKIQNLKWLQNHNHSQTLKPVLHFGGLLEECATNKLIIN